MYHIYNGYGIFNLKLVSRLMGIQTIQGSCVFAVDFVMPREIETQRSTHTKNTTKDTPKDSEMLPNLVHLFLVT